ALISKHHDARTVRASLHLDTDQICTGGPYLAAAQQVDQLGAQVYEAAAIIDQPDLDGSRLIQDAGIATFTLCAFEENEYVDALRGQCPRSDRAGHTRFPPCQPGLVHFLAGGLR